MDGDLKEQIKYLLNLYNPEGVEEVEECDLCGGKSFRLIKSMIAKEWKPVRKYYFNKKIASPFLGLPRKFKLMSCNDCQMVFVNPRIKDEIVNRFYEEYLSGKYKGYINTYDSSFREKDFLNYFDFIKPFLPKRKKRLFLDIGCATGEFLKVANKFGFKSVGIEVSPTAAKSAKRYGRVLVGDVVSKLKDLSDKEFDLVTLIDSLEHFRSPRKALALVSGRLKKRGILLIETPNYLSGCDEMSRHFYLFSKVTMRKLIMSTGYNLIKLAARDSKYNPQDARQKERFLIVVASKK